MQSALFLRLLSLAFMLLVGCAQATEDSAAQDAPATQGVEPATMAVALSQLPEFSHFRTLLRRAGFSAALSNPQTAMTLLVPRDSAFAQLPAEGRAAIMAMPATQLVPKLRAMMIPRIIHAEELRTRIIDGGGQLTMTSMAGTPISFRQNGSQFIVSNASGSASMGSADLATGNGAIYILDHWIGPTG